MIRLREAPTSLDRVFPERVKASVVILFAHPKMVMGCVWRDVD